MSEKLYIKIQVPFQTAVRFGEVESGYFTLAPTAQELQTLTQEERILLSQVPRHHVEDKITVWLHQYGPSERADFSAVKPLLALAKAKIEQEATEEKAKKAQEAAKKAQEDAVVAQQVRVLVDLIRSDVRALKIQRYYSSDDCITSNTKIGTDAFMLYVSVVTEHLGADAPGILDIVRAEFARRAEEVEKKAAEERNIEALRKATEKALDRVFLERHGTPEQVERYDEGFMPEDEFLTVVRNTLFEPFNVFARYGKLKKDDLDHDDDCSHSETKFRVEKAEELSSDLFARFKQLRTIGETFESATVTPYVHTASCTECSARNVNRYSAKVEIDWNGRKLSREYQMDG
jgi:hypothetical protein